MTTHHLEDGSRAKYQNTMYIRYTSLNNQHNIHTMQSATLIELLLLHYSHFILLCLGETFS